MDIEARQMYRRAVAVAAAATVSVALGEHAATRTPSSAPFTDRRAVEQAWGLDRVPAASWSATGDAGGFERRPAVQVKRASACPSRKPTAAPQLARSDGASSQD